MHSTSELRRALPLLRCSWINWGIGQIQSLPSYILAYDCSTATQVSCDLNIRCSRTLASLSRTSRPTCAKGKTGKSGRSGHLIASWMPTPLLLTQCRVFLQSVSCRHSYFGLIDVMASESIGTTDGTIRIFGAPGVETNLSLPSHAPIKFLQFATNLFKLVCVGEYGMVPLSTDSIMAWICRWK